MTLTNTTKLRSVTVNGDFAEDASAAVVAEGGEAQVITPSVDIAGNETGDWTWSATAEGRTGEVAGDTGVDVDGDPGLIYSGPAGNAVRVSFKNLDVAAGLIAPEAADTVTAAILKNNDVIAFADEGFVAELDAVTAEFNADTYVGGLQSGDVIRVALIGGGEETLDLDVAEGGSVDIV